MPKKLFSSQSLLASDVSSFRRQESIFIGLNLLILAVLFSLHWCFAGFWGKPAFLLTAVGSAGGLLKVAEWAWLQRISVPLKRQHLALLTWGSVSLTIILATILAVLTDKEDTPYFVLMVVAVVESAFRFELPAIVGVIAASSGSLFFQVWWFYRGHPPFDVAEYFEAGITSLLFAFVGVLVWLLLADLRRKEIRLASNVLELERAREQLLREERLAAMGRISSAIAHEIRNPVAMIVSSIATAKKLAGVEREEMFSIAADEANRLTQLTTEFLDYASVRPPKLEVISLAEMIDYATDAARAHAAQKGVHFRLQVDKELRLKVDVGQLQQALMNLLLNAVDASPPGESIELRARTEEANAQIEIENAGRPIPEDAVERIFEPFFTTKPRGSGLGLAIARNLVRAQQGDVVLLTNSPDRICFRMTLPLAHGETIRELQGSLKNGTNSISRR